MLTLVSAQGTLSPEEILFLRQWINRLENLKVPYTREKYLADLKSFLRETGDIEEFRVLRPRLVEKMKDSPKEELSKFAKVLSKLDDYLIKDLCSQLIGEDDLTERGKSLSNFRKFVETSEQNLILKRIFEEVEFGWSEYLVHLAEKKLQEQLLPPDHQRLIDAFRSKMQNGELISEKDLEKIVLETKVCLLPLHPYKPFSPPSKSSRPASFIKASLSQFSPADSKKERLIPLNSCSNPEYFFAQGSAVLAPFDGLWLVMGKVDFEFTPSMENLSIRLAKNNASLAESTVWCSEEHQAHPSIGVSGTFALKKGDNLTIVTLANKVPIKLLSAELIAVFVGEYFN